MRKKIVAGNWKMNLDYSEGLSLFSEIANMVKDEITGSQQAVICTPFIHLSSVAQLAKGYDKVAVGAQNAHQNESGAYTGEISAKMVKSTGATYVILGHSERRQYFGEDNQLLSQKTETALKNGLKPIFCIGETLDEREGEQHFEVIKTQLKEGVFHLSTEQFEQLVLAYEPVCLNRHRRSTLSSAKKLLTITASKWPIAPPFYTAVAATLKTHPNCLPSRILTEA
jgi:triosephosphate isomerase